MATEEELRKLAVRAIKRKRDFWNHLIAYCIVNAFLVVIWYWNGRGYFWPGWVLAGWASASPSMPGRRTGAAVEPSARTRSSGR